MVNLRVVLSSEQEAATARYVEINKLFREILIEIAPFHGSVDNTFSTNH